MAAGTFVLGLHFPVWHDKNVCYGSVQHALEPGWVWMRNFSDLAWLRGFIMYTRLFELKDSCNSRKFSFVVSDAVARVGMLH